MGKAVTNDLDLAYNVRVLLFSRLTRVKAQMTEREFLAEYDRFADAIFRHCFFRVYDRELARDLVQQTFLKTWEYIVSGKEIDNIRGFLYRVATNLIIDQARKARPVSLDELLEKGFDPGDTKGQNLEILVDSKYILEKLAELPTDDKNLIIMRYVDGLGPKEIANILGLTENVVSVRLNRAIKELKGLLNS